MPDVKPEQDASIEEILESIRQIINEDGDVVGGAAPAAAPVTPPKPAAAPSTLTGKPAATEDAGTMRYAAEPEAPASAILDLTEKVSPEKMVPDLGPDLMNPSYDPDPPPIIDLQEAPDMPAQPYDDDNSLLSETTADAAASEMAKLLAQNVAVERDEPARIGRVTLEDLARDLMRPLIKTWLDENLPRVIEKVVSRELDKLARRARDE